MSVTSGAAKLRNHYKHLVYLLYRFCIAFMKLQGAGLGWLCQASHGKTLRWGMAAIRGRDTKTVALYSRP